MTTQDAPGHPQGEHLGGGQAGPPAQGSFTPAKQSCGLGAGGQVEERGKEK